jgi:hypothetical protein
LNAGHHLSDFWIVVIYSADFSWLQEKIRDGAITIDWRTIPIASLSSAPLTGRIIRRDQALILIGKSLNVLLIAHGATPSVFFRFPGRLPIHHY